MPSLSLVHLDPVVSLHESCFALAGCVSAREEVSISNSNNFFQISIRKGSVNYQICRDVIVTLELMMFFNLQAFI